MPLLSRLSMLEECVADVFPGATERFTGDVAIYLAHTLNGDPMRAIARARGGAPSTILRTVRRVEAMREDRLIDDALERIEIRLKRRPTPNGKTEEAEMAQEDQRVSDIQITRSEAVALNRLAEADAFILVAKGAEKAGVFCAKNNFRRPLSLVSLASATRFVASDWVRCVSKTDLSVKYVITSAGRAALRRFEAYNQSAGGRGADDAIQSIFASQHQAAGVRRFANPKTGEIETVRVNLGESPLGWLARRKDANGCPLLAPDEVEAGERLREDFELAQMGPRVGQDWRRFLTPSDGGSGPGRTPSEGPMFARQRVAKALEALGSGLADAALRICCFHEGLEATERRMGWSARSGKVVLKLALQRLVEHYGIAAQRDAA